LGKKRHNINVYGSLNTTKQTRNEKKRNDMKRNEVKNKKQKQD